MWYCGFPLLIVLSKEHLHIVNEIISLKTQRYIILMEASVTREIVKVMYLSSLYHERYYLSHPKIRKGVKSKDISSKTK